MPTDIDFKELRVAITGGTSGLGLALVRLFVARGARVAFIARTARAVERIAQETGACGIVGDIGRKEDIYPVALQITGNLGGLNVLINNASTLGAVPLPAIAVLARETFFSLFEVNVFAPIHLTQQALTLMARSGVSTIVNVTSDAGVEAYPAWGGYGATKAALEHVSRVLAAELEGSSTRVLVFDPGDMNTAMHRDAVPDADPAELRDPADSARALLRAITDMKGGFERVRASDLVPA